MRQTSTVKIRIEVVKDAEGLVALAREAEQDGHRMVSRLIGDWRDGTNRFERPGESLYLATLEGEVAGVCGLNIDPYLDDPRVGRVRRLYVSTAHRRRGLGSLLVSCIVDDARQSFDVLRLRTRNPIAAAFYESLGFARVEGDRLHPPVPRRPCSARLVVVTRPNLASQTRRGE